MNDLHQKFFDALNSEEPERKLQALVQKMLSNGYERELLLTEMEKFRVSLQETRHEKEEDTVLEVMDFLVGWCSPHMKME